MSSEMNQGKSGSADMDGIFSNDAAKKRGVPGWIKGCGFGCLALILLVAGAAAYGYHVLSGRYEQIKKDAQGQGYKMVQEPEIRVREKITEKTLYVGSVVELEAGSDADISIVAEACKLSGKFTGKVTINSVGLLIDPKVEINELEGNVLNFMNLGKVHNKKAWVLMEAREMPAEMKKSFEHQYGMDYTPVSETDKAAKAEDGKEPAKAADE